jgi:kynurenine formamidase
MLIRLSHTLREGDPAFGRPASLRVHQRSSFETGVCQTYLLELGNHDGTHIDAPSHFNPKGRPIADFPPDELVFRSPKLLEIPKERASLIELDEIKRFNDLEGHDMLLIRTGYARFRRSDPRKFSRESPCLSPEAASFIVEELRDVRCIGVDCVSIGSPAFPEETVQTHRILTGCEGYGSRYVLIIEDMNLDQDLSGLKRVMVVPLYVEGVDSMPCTVLAEV